MVSASLVILSPHGNKVGATYKKMKAQITIHAFFIAFNVGLSQELLFTCSAEFETPNSFQYFKIDNKDEPLPYSKGSLLVHSKKESLFLY